MAMSINMLSRLSYVKSSFSTTVRTKGKGKKKHSFPSFLSVSCKRNMETVGTICEGEWSSSFDGICEEADFMAQLLGNYAHPSASFWAANESSYKDASGEESSVYSSEETNASIFSFSLGNNSITFPSSSYSFANNNGLMAMDYGKNSVVAGHDFLNREDSVDSDDKMQVDVLQESFKEEKISSPSEISKKRPQIPSGSQRSKRIKKSAKADENDESNNTTSGCSSEDDSINASNEANGVKSSLSSKRSGAENIKGKARASRGSATDPQSLYARKRRERINERLRVLQTLVPNGTKVDISTMLEEAVIYVKFLQLQIKLLSSDDLWMYAPIAYNGMDLGLDFKNTPSPTPQSS